jgi:hypothetical protein
MRLLPDPTHERGRPTPPVELFEMSDPRISCQAGSTISSVKRLTSRPVDAHSRALCPGLNHNHGIMRSRYYSAPRLHRTSRHAYITHSPTIISPHANSPDILHIHIFHIRFVFQSHIIYLSIFLVLIVSDGACRKFFTWI